MSVLNDLAKVNKIANWRELRIRIAYCPVCGCRRVAVKFDANEMAIRCLSCRASAVTMSIVSVLRRVAPDIGSLDVYELSSRGPLFRYLNSHSKSLAASEYFADVASGEFRNGMQCQDVQRLSYPGASFDICTFTEVFEHVPDDLKGFSEIFRVLKPGGFFVFSVPLQGEYATVERAVISAGGQVQHLLPPEYHGDPLCESRPILAFRNYGRDITDRLRSAGFAKAEIVMPGDAIPWGFSRPVVVAYHSVAPIG